MDNVHWISLEWDCDDVDASLADDALTDSLTGLLVIRAHPPTQPTEPSFFKQITFVVNLLP